MFKGTMLARLQGAEPLGLLKSSPEESRGQARTAFEVMPEPLSCRNLAGVGVGKGKRCICRWKLGMIPAP